MRILFDTNVLISAFLAFQRGSMCYDIIDHAVESHEIYYTNFITKQRGQTSTLETNNQLASVRGYWQSAVSFQLSAISYQLSAFSYQLSAFSYQLSAFSYQLSAISFQLSAISYQLSAISFQQKLSNFSLIIVRTCLIAMAGLTSI